MFKKANPYLALTIVTLLLTSTHFISKYHQEKKLRETAQTNVQTAVMDSTLHTELAIGFDTLQAYTGRMLKVHREELQQLLTSEQQKLLKELNVKLKDVKQITTSVLTLSRQDTPNYSQIDLGEFKTAIYSLSDELNSFKLTHTLDGNSQPNLEFKSTARLNQLIYEKKLPRKGLHKLCIFKPRQRVFQQTITTDNKYLELEYDKQLYIIQD